MIKDILLITVITLIVITAVIYGFSKVGSPADARSIKFDQKRIQDISQISSAIQTYAYDKNKLPDKLSEVKDYLYGSKDIVDPETKKEYEYKKGTFPDYEICTTFSTDSKNNKTTDYLSYADDLNNHPKGYYCIKLKLSQTGTYANPSPFNLEELTPAQHEEGIRAGRDGNRLNDLDLLQRDLYEILQESTASAVKTLCAQTGKYPCSGRSTEDSRSADGNGWVKVNISKDVSRMPFLPIDPQNDTQFHYTYCADKDSWEANARLESNDYGSHAGSDGGDNGLLYEVGTNKELIGKVPGCHY